MKEVLVDMIAEYTVVIGYPKLWLYRDGDECIDMTGGWGNETSYFNNYKPHILYGHSDGTALVHSAATHVAMVGGEFTYNNIDLTNYSKVHVFFDLYTCSIGTEPQAHAKYASYPRLCFRGERYGPLEYPTAMSFDAPINLSNTELTYDISNLTGSAEFGIAHFYGWINGAQAFSSRISKIWFE